MTGSLTSMSLTKFSLAKFPGWLAGSPAWQRLATAMVCGALATAALPPLHVIPLLIPAFTGLVWLLDGVKRPRQAAILGWAFGFGHFATGLYWVGIAFFVDADRFAAVMPLAIGGLAAGMAIFPALATYAVARIAWPGPARIVLLAMAWLVTEWLRSWIFTGLPWNLIGTVWVFSPAMLQIAAVTGVWGLSLLTVLAAAAPAVLGDRRLNATETAGNPGKKLAAWLFVGATMAALAATWFGGALRLTGAPEPGTDIVEGVTLRLVQPNIAQAVKWQPELRQDHVQRQMQLSSAAGAASPGAKTISPVSHIIWAETAVPFLLSQEAALRRDLSGIIPPDGLLITGAPRSSNGTAGRRLWNSLHALDSQGKIRATYDKTHLVPFGEYAPFRSILDAAKLTAGNIDFSPGPGPQTLSLPGLPPFSPLICYEIIFPGQVVAAGAERPQWLLNITNDAWFGLSSGPYQHFAAARLRAVEEGLPLVRVANTGISAVTDGYGRIIGRLDLNREGFLDSPLPRPVDKKTLFSQVGNVTVLILLLISLATALTLRRLLPLHKQSY